MKDYFVLQVKLVFDMAALRSLLVLCLLCALVFEVRKYLVYEASLPPSLSLYCRVVTTRLSSTSSVTFLLNMYYTLYISRVDTRNIIIMGKRMSL